jgi:hypothetical protein
MSQPNPGSWPQKTVIDVRTRKAAFREFKCLTGQWPVLSAALYVGRFVLMFVLISILFWYGRLHAENVNRVTMYALIGFLPVIFIWNILETLAWNHELRRKNLISRGMYLGLTQLPSG